MYTKTITDMGESLTLEQDGQRLSIPADPDNRHYAEYLKWVSGGGVATLVDQRPTQAARDSAMAKAKIFALEVGQDRAIREAVLYGDKTYLQAVEDGIVAERGKL